MSETTMEQQIAQEFRYEPESRRECRNCGHAFPHDVGAGSLQYCRGYQCDSECTESDRLIADLRHALAMERAKVESGITRVIDGKFVIKDGQIVKASSGEIVPEDEPLVLMRARDYLALPTIEHYRKLCVLDGVTDYQLRLVDELIAKFREYASDPRRMKQPGITRGAAWNGHPSTPPVDPAPKEPEDHARAIEWAKRQEAIARDAAPVWAEQRDVLRVPPVDPTGLDTLNALTGERSHRLGVDETLRESEAAAATDYIAIVPDSIVCAKCHQTVPDAEWRAHLLACQGIYMPESPQLTVITSNGVTTTTASPPSPSDREPVREALERWLDAEDEATASATRDTMAEYRERIADVTRRYEDFNAAQVAYRRAGIAKRDAAKSEGA